MEDSEFLLDAIRTDIAEVRMGELAQQRSQSAKVREYGAKLIADHSRSMQEVSALVKRADVDVPTEPSAMALEHYQALARLAGGEFDAAFVDHMIMGHREAIELFSKQTHANPNKELSDLAARTLPTLREHLAIAESLQTHETGQSHSGSHSVPVPQRRSPGE